MILQCQDIIIIWLRLNNDWKNLNTPEKEQGKDKKKIAYHDAIKLYNTLLSIYFNDYNISDEKKKKIWVKNIILIIYLLKVIDFLNRGKKIT